MPMLPDKSSPHPDERAIAHLGFKRFCRLLMMGSLAILLLIVGILVVWVGFSGLDHVNAVLLTTRPWFTVWRMTLYSGLLVFWPSICERLSRTYRLDADTLATLQALRWRAAALFLVGELFLVQNVLGRLFSGH